MRSGAKHGAAEPGSRVLSGGVRGTRTSNLATRDRVLGGSKAGSMCSATTRSVVDEVHLDTE